MFAKHIELLGTKDCITTGMMKDPATSEKVFLKSNFRKNTVLSLSS